VTLLCADIGNSHTVLGLVSDGVVGAHWRVATDERRTSDEWAVLLRGLLADARHREPLSGIAVCATVPAVLHEWREMLASHFGKVTSVVVEPGVRTGVPVLMDNPVRWARTGSSMRWPPRRCTAAPRSSSTSAPPPLSTW
jgi:type III pantothenate kinase